LGGLPVLGQYPESQLGDTRVSPGALQHEVLLCRTGIVTNSKPGTDPVLQRVISCRAAPGSRRVNYGIAKVGTSLFAAAKIG
jgi:hypothetical protein